jgi:type IV pilus assembly protein PilY1
VISRSISANLIPYYGTTTKRGWFLDLAIDSDDDGDLDGIGERFIGVPRIQGGKVFFATFTPEGDGCSPGGKNFLYGLDLVSGAGALSGVQTLPSYATACTGSNCGAVALEPASTNAPPVMSTTMAAVKPVVPVGGPGTCVPGTPLCPSFEQCQVVIYPGGLVLPRACGRQSWRQVR